MAINLGEINFGLGPDTRRLRSAVQDIVRFGSAVNQAAAQTARGMNAAEQALRRQEMAAIRAFQQTKTLQDAMSRAGLTASQQARLLNTTTGALQLYVREMTRGQRTTLDMQRATERFNLTLQSNRLALKAWTEEAQQATKSNFIGFLQRVAQTSVLIAGPLSGAAARLTTFASIATHVGIRLAAIAAGAAAAAAGFAFLAKSAITTAQKYEGLTLTLESVTGSHQRALDELDRVRDVANKTGGDLVILSRAWARMSAAAQGTALSGERAWNIFQQISFVSAKLGASVEDTAGVFRAIEQIMSKGTLSAEELQGQLGDRLPAAVQIMAQSLGMGTGELRNMMKQGRITSDALVAFADVAATRLGVDVTQNIDTIAAATGRVSNAWDQFNLQVDQSLGISSAWKNLLNGLAVRLDATTAEVKREVDWITAWIDRVKTAAREGLVWAGVLDTIAEAGRKAMFRDDVYGFNDPVGSVKGMKKSLAFSDDAMGWDAYISQDMDQLKAALTALNPIRDKPETESSINKRLKAIREANQAIMDLGASYKQLFMTPGAQQWAEMQQDINTQTQDFADRLKDAGVAADVAAQLTAKYNLSLQMLKQSELQAAQTVTVMELLSDAFQQAGNSAVDAFVDALFAGENALVALGNIAKQTAAEILKQMLKLAVINPLLNAIFGTALPGLGGIFGTGAGMGSVGPPMSIVPQIHKGTNWAHAGAGPLRAVAASAFTHAPRLHGGTGLKSDEFAAVLQEGETVIPRGGRAGGNTYVNVRNYGQEMASVERTRVGADEYIDVIVGKVMGKIGTGGADGMMRSRYGLKPSQRRAFS